MTIAHRLNTIIDYDRILVMSAGEVVEDGPPAELVVKEGGIFASMVAETGKANAQALIHLAMKNASEEEIARIHKHAIPVRGDELAGDESETSDEEKGAEKN